jgi:hypothetical protein
VEGRQDGEGFVKVCFVAVGANPVLQDEYELPHGAGRVEDPLGGPGLNESLLRFGEAGVHGPRRPPRQPVDVGLRGPRLLFLRVDLNKQGADLIIELDLGTLRPGPRVELRRGRTYRPAVLDFCGRNRSSATPS